MHRDRKLLDLANGQACMNCGRCDGTVVAAHSNWSDHGKGGKLKAHDCFHAWLCNSCHSWLDQGSTGMDPTGTYHVTKYDKREMFTRAMERTVLQLWLQGLIRVA